MKEIKQETNRPKGNLPYQDVNRPFRMQFVIPGPGITIEQDKNGVLYISAQGGSSVSDIIAGDNIEIEHREDGSVVISSVNSVTDISAGQNVTIDIDPDTGTAVINAITGGEPNEHYKGVFDTTEDLIEAVPDPEVGDYGLIKEIIISDGGKTSWTGRYKYCFYIDGTWTVVDQMLTFTKNIDLLKRFFSVGGGSPTIYLHDIARTGDFNDLSNIPIVATPVVTVEGTTVTVTCATEGAEIWYTTDGTMPHVNGTKYTGPITASGATTFRFVGIKNGMINSLEAVASADYELQAPVITLDWQTGIVTMTNPNVDGNGDPVGDIYYTRQLGNDTPSVRTLYTGPISTLNNSYINVTFRADVDDGNKRSSETEESYQRCGLTGRRGSNSASGLLHIFYFVRIGNNDVWTQAPDGEVHYTTDGAEATYESPLMESTEYRNMYGGPYVFNFIGLRPGYLPVKISNSIGYSTPSAPSVTFNSDTNTVTLARAGNVLSYGISLETDMSDPTKNCRIFYTLDGSTPTDQSTLYTGPFQISESVTVKAVLIAYGEYSSDVSELEIQVMDAPQFSLDWHTGRVTMTNPNEEGSIYYTLDGSEPTSESSVYSSPVLLTNAATVKAKVISENGSSATAEQAYTKAQAPLINDGNTSITWNLNKLSGNYSVKMTTRQTGGVTKYTSLSEGYIPSDPTWASQEFVNELSAPFFEEITFKARTFAEGYLPSAVTSMTFGTSVVHPVVIGYDETAGTVSFTRQWFTAQIPLQTNNNTPELGCRVYYTLDGTTPDDTSTLWDGNPVTVDPGTTVKALLVCYGRYESEVATYNVPGGGYTPDPWMRLRGDEGGGSFAIGSDADLHLEISSDGETWTALAMMEDDGMYHTDLISLQEDETVYIRSTQSSETYNCILGFDGAIYADGNAYAVFGPEESDWRYIRAINFTPLMTEICGLTHIPDLPASELVEGDTYQSLENMLTMTNCNVGDGGSTFNFHLGVSAQDLYPEYISTPYDFSLAQYLGNTNGIELPPHISFVFNKNMEIPVNSWTLEEWVSETNGTLAGNMIFFDDFETAYATMTVNYMEAYVSYDDGVSWNSITTDASPFDLPGIEAGACYSFILK